MFTDFTIKIYAGIIPLALALIGFVVFLLPGALLGLITGGILALPALEWMRRLTPDGRRRYRRMRRNEGLE